jgi:hypothetical protein
LTSVFAPGELPATPHVWIVQQRRWKIGLCQNARTHIPRLLAAATLSPSQRFGGLLHLGTIWWPPLVGSVMFHAACVAAILEPQWLPVFIAVQLALFVTAHAEQLVHLRIGQRFVRGSAVPLRRFLVDFLNLSILILRLEIANIGVWNWRPLMRRNEALRWTPTGAIATRGRPSVSSVPR